MYHPRMIQHYNYLVIECEVRAIDACVDVALYENINPYDLASWLFAIDAVQAHRLHVRRSLRRAPAGTPNSLA